MELRQLRYFLAVADARSFVGAANGLFLSRQAVSKAVAQLEQELGVELFMRDSNGAFLTPAGLMFYDKIRSNVLDLDAARDEMLQYGSRYHQRIRMAVCVGAMQMYEPALQIFGRASKNVELSWYECPDEQCLAKLREQEADLAICTEKPQNDMFSAQPIARSDYGVLLKQTGQLEGSVEARDLSWLPLAGMADAANKALCKQLGLAMEYTGYDRYRLFSLTAQGKCAMLLPRCMVPRELPGLCWLPLEDAPPWVLYGVCLQSMENNVLYHTVVEELQMRVFAREETAHV